MPSEFPGKYAAAHKNRHIATKLAVQKRSAREKRREFNDDISVVGRYHFCCMYCGAT
jgi:hypothetical protein